MKWICTSDLFTVLVFKTYLFEMQANKETKTRTNKNVRNAKTITNKQKQGR